MSIWIEPVPNGELNLTPIPPPGRTLIGKLPVAVVLYEATRIR